LHKRSPLAADNREEFIMASFLRILGALGVIPPHEFAYGTQLENVGELSNYVRQILSLEFFDPRKTRIKVSLIGKSGGIQTLSKYCSDLAKRDSGLDPLAVSLKQIDGMQPDLETSIQMIDRLVEYRESLNDEASQDEIIVFIHFGLKNPELLDPATRDTIARLVERVDTSKQARQFNTGQCPQRFLKGNINIYPRAIENTSWYHLANLEMSDQTRPILELRFMGLGGVFIYILDEIETRLGYKFFHLDGESIDADRQDIHAW
jgi:hypothetical protein